MVSLDVQNRDLLDVQGGQPRRPEQRSSRGTGWEEVHGGQPRRPEQRWYRVVSLDVRTEI